MTREEASSVLDDYDVNFDGHTAEEIAEAFDVAFRALEQESITKNDLGVDCTSREQALRELKESAEHHANDSREEVLLRRDRDIIRALPSVTPQEPRKLEQEQDKPMVEIDLYSVIKQKYIDRDVLGKIRAEIEQNAYPIVHGVNNHELGMTLHGILQVIDKYKAESEG